MGRRTKDPSEELRLLLDHPWTIEVRRYEDGHYFARIKELPGCMTEADSKSEVLDALEEAQLLWLESALDNGDHIPLPAADENYSGKIFVRTSPRLHREVAEAAESQGISMSQFVAEVLAGVVGVKDAIKSRRARRSVQTEEAHRG
ncbi:MAG TPA: type II toxin-antitoxin system HicB family antitoxin [Actinomycetota bacterium]|jgi:predicted RNase H-like HicB family nuclease